MQNAIENMDTNDDSQKAYRSKKHETKHGFCTSANELGVEWNGYIRLNLDFYGLRHQKSNMNLVPSTKQYHQTPFANLPASPVEAVPQWKLNSRNVCHRISCSKLISHCFVYPSVLTEKTIL